ncbi:methionyl-tRNA formyltransferase [Rubritalea marina]|uniref:methionyl-tRNA formyltransferase n=1 Tax=Rubritalea marina TaxID=361055 RepID=UPI000360E1B8|nr:methionyl-tRNA formyltransferase [Rubritalea marina]
MADTKRILFMATGDIAIPSFKALLADTNYETVALITQPDKPVGRKQVLTPPQVKVIAEELGIPVFQPSKVKEEAELELIRSLKPDVIVVMAYGQILPKALLEIPNVAIINLHASLLPKHRGASCIQAAIDQGDAESGMTVMHVTEGLDEGDVILRKPFALPASITGGELHDRLAEDGPECLLSALQHLFDGSAGREPQDEALSNYAPKLLRKHGEIDWSRDAAAIERRVRAYHPWPGTSTSFTDTKGKVKRLKIFPPVSLCQDTKGAVSPGLVTIEHDQLYVHCGDGQCIQLQTVQVEGKKAMSASDFIRGGLVCNGASLG